MPRCAQGVALGYVVLGFGFSFGRRPLVQPIRVKSVNHIKTAQVIFCTLLGAVFAQLAQLVGGETDGFGIGAAQRFEHHETVAGRLLYYPRTTND